MSQSVVAVRGLPRLGGFQRLRGSLSPWQVRSGAPVFYGAFHELRLCSRIRGAFPATPARVPACNRVATSELGKETLA